MKIDLTKIPVYVINAYPQRRPYVLAQLAAVGIKPIVIDGVIAQPKVVGCGLSHLKVLESAPQPPFLILEDDVAVTEHFRPVIDTPHDPCGPDPDVVYLGVSSWGSDGKRGIENGTIAKPYNYNEDWLRLFNMCSSHAILYIDSGFISAAKLTILKSLCSGIPFDIGLANMQDIHGERWWAVTPNNPFFYQADCVGGAEGATRNSLLSIRGLVPDGEPDQGNELRSMARTSHRAFSLET